MKILQSPKKQFLIFLFLFFILNFLQSYFTGLLDDEAYYWVWSKDLAFGYFDHPPLVALWIKISSMFFSGELGVRFFSTISFSLMLYFIWLCIDDKRKWQYVWLYFLLIVSVALLNIYGFVTVPDTPLLLFASIFIYAYKRFLEVNALTYALILGFAMAGLLYSKYHGVLVIVFVLLSNLSLLKNKYFWIASIIGTLLFIPHLLWQIDNDFPSVKYHLFERSKKPYRFDYTLMHFVNLIVIIGLPFPLIYSAFFRKKITTTFDKGLQYIVYGFIIFFFLSTFKTSTQAQWNVLILIPLVILTFNYFIDHQKARKWLIYLGLANLFIMLIARLFLASSNISPIPLETHGGNEWAQKIKDKTNNRPIVFIGSYKKASKYNFYTGIQTHSYSTLKTRKSQYDLLNTEAKMQHKNVTVEGRNIEGYPLHGEGKKLHFGVDINNYSTHQKIECKILEKELVFQTNEQNYISFEIFNPYQSEVNLRNLKFIGVFQGKKNAVIEEVPLQVNANFSIKPNERRVMKASLIVPKITSSEILTFRVGVKFYQLPVGFQGNKVKASVKNE